MHSERAEIQGKSFIVQTCGPVIHSNGLCVLHNYFDYFLHTNIINVSSPQAHSFWKARYVLCAVLK